MSRWSVTVDAFTPIAVANAANFTDQGYFAIQGVASSHRIKIADVLISGQEATSAPTPLKLARDVVMGATSLVTTGILIDNFSPAAQALPNMPAAFNGSTTKPQRHSTKHILNLGLNAWGGIIHWAALDPTEVIEISGNTQPYGEASISAVSGGAPGKVSATLQLELE